MDSGASPVLPRSRDRRAADVFRDVFAAFRTGYVLRYSPQGVKREGWHEIAVTIPKVPGAEIRARRGYAVDASASPLSRGT